MPLINIRLSPFLLNRLRLLCKQYDVSMSDVVRDGIAYMTERYLSEEAKRVRPSIDKDKFNNNNEQD